MKKCLPLLLLLAAGCAKIDAIKADSARLPAIQADAARLPAIQADTARLSAIQTDTARLPGMQTDMAAALALLQKRDATVRIAYVDGNRLNTLTAAWRQRRIDEAMAKLALTPEVKAQLEAYDRALAQFNAWAMSRQRNDPRMPPMGNMAGLRSDPEYQPHLDAVDQARAPVAEIVERRNRLQSETRYPVGDLIAEYVNDRFDLVLDRSWGGQSVLYSRAKEIPDITEGVVALLESKEKTASR